MSDRANERKTHYLDMQKWDDCVRIILRDGSRGMECWAGLSFGHTYSIASFVLVFHMEETFFVLPFFWATKESLHHISIQNKEPCEQWVSHGQIIVVSGEDIDFNSVLCDIIKISKIFNIKEIAFDRWGSQRISEDLQEAGFNIIAFGQGFQSMSAPTKALLSLILQKNLIHGGNAVLRWMASNLMVDRDPAGNVKPNKSKSSGNINGIVALIMALDRAMRSLSNKTPIKDPRNDVEDSGMAAIAGCIARADERKNENDKKTANGTPLNTAIKELTSAVEKCGFTILKIDFTGFKQVSGNVFKSPINLAIWPTEEISK